MKTQEYNSETHPTIANKLYCMGCTPAEVARFFEVSESTITEWEIIYPEFGKESARGRTLADAEVTLSLYRQAVGYNYSETLSFKVQTSEFTEEIRQVSNEKHCPPNMEAVDLWFERRKIKYVGVEE